MENVATDPQALAEEQAKKDFIASQSRPVLTEEILDITDSITSNLPNCYDFDRFAKHMRHE